MFTLNCKGRMVIIDEPMIMGIINVTPDSFYEASRINSNDSLLKQAEKMIANGADIIDIGGQSTRPGSVRIEAEEEIKRVIPAVEIVHRTFPELLLSIDTYHAKVAKAAIDAGASIVNDISAGAFDNTMIHTVASLKVPYVCMHMRGTPENMQQLTQYENVTKEILDFFIRKTDQLKQAGINDIILDPGFGFAKTAAHNFQLLKELAAFGMLGHPIMIGLSRKASIYKTLDVTVEESLNGTTILNTLAILHGAHILRVHDVREAKQVVTLLAKLNT